MQESCKSFLCNLKKPLLVFFLIILISSVVNGWIGGDGDATCNTIACNLSDDDGYLFTELDFIGTTGFSDGIDNTAAVDTTWFVNVSWTNVTYDVELQNRSIVRDHNLTWITDNAYNTAAEVYAATPHTNRSDADIEAILANETIIRTANTTWAQDQITGGANISVSSGIVTVNISCAGWLGAGLCDGDDATGAVNYTDVNYTHVYTTVLYQLGIPVNSLFVGTSWTNVTYDAELDNATIIRTANITWIYASAPHTNLSTTDLYTLAPHTNRTDSDIEAILDNATIIRTGNTSWAQDQITGGANISVINGVVTVNATGWDTDASDDLSLVTLDNSSVVRSHNTSWIIANQITYTNSSWDLSQIPNTGNVNLGDNNFSINTSVFFVDSTNDRVGIGTNAPDSILHIKANTPGTVGSHDAGQLIIQDPDDTVFGNVVITAYESDGAGNPDQQLWYLGSSSGSNTDIIFLNRRNANLHLGTSGVSRLTILGDGSVGIGTATPTAKLDVAGLINATSYRLDGSTITSWDDVAWDEYSDMPYNSTKCTGTNKVVNVSIVSSGIEILCAADVVGGAGVGDKWLDNGDWISPNTTFASIVNATKYTADLGINITKMGIVSPAGATINASEFYDDGVLLVDTDTNASTACSNNEVLLGDGTCYDLGNIQNSTRNRTGNVIYAQLSDLKDQPFATTNTPQPLNFSTEDEIYGLVHSTTVNSSEITIVTPAIYTMISQPQVATGAGGAGTFHMWLEKWDTTQWINISNTNVELVLASNEENVIPLIATLRLNSGEKVRIMGSVSDTAIKLDAQTPTGEPVIPSIIFSMFEVGGTNLSYIGNCTGEGSCSLITYDTELQNRSIVRSHNTSWLYSWYSGAGYYTTTNHTAETHAPHTNRSDADIEAILANETVIRTANTTWAQDQITGGANISVSSGIVTVNISCAGWLGAGLCDGDDATGAVNYTDVNYTHVYTTVLYQLGIPVNSLFVGTSWTNVTYDVELQNRSIVRDHNLTWITDNAYNTAAEVYAATPHTNRSDADIEAILANETIIRTANTTWVTDNQHLWNYSDATLGLLNITINLRISNATQGTSADIWHNGSGICIGAC